MEKLKKATTQLIILIMMSSFSFANIFSFMDSERPYENELNKLLNRYIKKTCQEKKMILIGLGGQEIECIELINLHFHSKETLSLTQSRELIVDCTEKLLKEINNNTKLTPYLENIPFINNNISIIIGFHKDEENRVDPPFIAYIGLSKGNITYDEGLPNYQYKHVHRETYDEALKIVQSQMTIPSTDHSKMTNLLDSKGT